MYSPVRVVMFTQDVGIVPERLFERTSMELMLRHGPPHDAGSLPVRLLLVRYRMVMRNIVFQASGSVPFNALLAMVNTLNFPNVFQEAGKVP